MSDEQDISVADAMAQALEEVKAEEQPQEVQNDVNGEETPQAQAEAPKNEDAPAVEEKQSIEIPDELAADPFVDARTPEDFRKGYKGYQKTYTKTIQRVKTEEKEKYEKALAEMKAGYEKQVKEGMESLRREMRSDSNPQPDVQNEDSLAGIFGENADPKALATFEKAVDIVANKRMKSVEEKIKQYDAYIEKLESQQKQDTELSQAQQAHSENTADLLKEFPELETDGTKRQEFVDHVQANPEEYRGLTRYSDMYRKYIWPKQMELAKQKAMAELKQKQTESLDTENAKDVAETGGELSLEAAWELSKKELAQQEK